MWKKNFVFTLICFVYLCATQFVVHAFTMHDIGETSHSDLSHLNIACKCGNDRYTHHIIGDFTISESSTQHDDTGCISTIKTIAKTYLSHIDILKDDDNQIHLYIYNKDPNKCALQTITSTIQPPGWSEFLDNHYGHGIVMLI